MGVCVCVSGDVCVCVCVCVCVHVCLCMCVRECVCVWVCGCFPLHTELVTVLRSDTMIFDQMSIPPPLASPVCS